MSGRLSVRTGGAAIIRCCQTIGICGQSAGRKLIVTALTRSAKAVRVGPGDWQMISDSEPGAARADALAAIAAMGSLRHVQVTSASTAWFGHWLGWPDWLRDGTSLPPTTGPLPDRISITDDLIISANLIDRADTGDLALRAAAGKAMAVGPITMLATAHAPTLGALLAFQPRALAAGSPLLSGDLVAADDRLILRFGTAVPLGRIGDFFGLMAMILFCRMLAGLAEPRMAEVVLESHSPEPPQGAAIAAALGCRMVFGAPATRLSVPATLAEIANPAHDPGLWLLVQERLQAAEAAQSLAFDVSRLRARVAQLLAEEQRVPRLKQVAAGQGLSVRSLARMLAAAGTSYQGIVDDERRQLAARLINNPLLGLNDMAAALGFPSASTFGRSFRRWFGDTPGRFRQRLVLPVGR